MSCSCGSSQPGPAVCICGFAWCGSGIVIICAVGVACFVFGDRVFLLNLDGNGTLLLDGTVLTCVVAVFSLSTPVT